MVFGERLRRLRQEKDMSQEDLARTLGYTKTAISQYELGKRTPDYATLNRIAEYFDTSADYLLGRTTLRKRTPDEQLLDMGIFLRGHGATEEDVRLIKNLIESRKLLKQQAERAQKHPNDKI